MKNLFVIRGGGEHQSHQAKIPTKSGKLLLSVVAGFGLYSSPREFIEDCSYSKVEIAIFDLNTNEWASYNQAKPVFDIIGNGEYRETDWDDNPIDPNEPQCAVFGYIDIDLVQKCIDAL